MAKTITRIFRGFFTSITLLLALAFLTGTGYFLFSALQSDPYSHASLVLMVLTLIAILVVYLVSCCGPNGADDDLPARFQDEVTRLKVELNEVIMVRKEFNRLREFVQHGLQEMQRFESETLPKLMKPLSTLRLEGLQRESGLENARKQLENQVADYLASMERLEELQRAAGPSGASALLGKCIEDAEKILHGLKIIKPLPNELFQPELHQSQQPLPSGGGYSIAGCQARGFIIGGRVIRRAIVSVSTPQEVKL